MKLSKLFIAAALPLFIASCEQELPYDLDGVTQSFAVSINKAVGSDLLLSAGSTEGDYKLVLEVPANQGDYKGFFKEAQILCVFTAKGEAPTSAVVAEGVTSFPATVTLSLVEVCKELGIEAPQLGDKMEFTTNIVHKDGTVVPGWTEVMGFNNRNVTYLQMEDGSKYNYCATYAAYAPLDLTKYVDGTVTFTESVGSPGEYTYSASMIVLPEIPEEVVMAGFTKEDYLGLKLTFDWYGMEQNVDYCIYLNKKDYSVSAPNQTVHPDYYIEGYSEVYGNGKLIFKAFNGALDTETNLLKYTATADWQVSAGTLSFGADNYMIQF